MEFQTKQHFLISPLLLYYSSPLDNTMCTLYGNVGAEACAANPESCQVDRISVMNEDGECPEYQCADGYAGELCNSKFTL